ncbi:MAG: uroporphyrinogen decarboxylase family protein, partial [Desulfatiglandales bacterium]
WLILDDFVAAGLDGWQGIQPRIGMDLKLLKEKYAGKLCFFGGVNCDTLVAGTPAAVKEEVLHAVRHAAPGGGLILTSGNTLLVGTKYENYMAMRSAAREFGSYPINV